MRCLSSPSDEVTRLEPTIMTTTYAVTDPHSGAVVKTYPTSTADDIENAVAAATATHHDWSRTSTIATRSALMKEVARLFEGRKSELAAIIVREMGKPLAEAIEEVEFSAWICGYYADNAERFLA